MKASVKVTPLHCCSGGEGRGVGRRSSLRSGSGAAGGRPVNWEVDGSRWASSVGRFEINGRCNGTKFHVGSQVVNCTNNNEIFSFIRRSEFSIRRASVRLVFEGIDPDVLVSSQGERLVSQRRLLAAD